MGLMVYKWFFVLTALFSRTQDVTLPSPQTPPLHPFYVSVTELNYNATDKNIEISCKIFTDDLEAALSRATNAKVDLVNPKDKDAVGRILSSYLLKHFFVKIDGRALPIEFVGFEKEEEAVWSYLQIGSATAPKQAEITNNVLYEMFAEQIHLLHMTVNGDRKSTKLVNPQANAVFEWK
jgi:hypothetical protein